MNLNRRHFMGTFAAAAAVGSLAACGKKVGDTAASGSSGSTAAASDISKATVAAGTELNYWTSWPQDTPQAKVFAKSIAAFTAKTGIKVNVKTLGSTASADVINALATGSGPDIFDNAPDHVAGFRARKFLADLKPVMDATSEGDSAALSTLIPEGIIKAASDETGLAFVPHSVMTSSIWYDSAAHPDLKGLDTWDGFVAACTELKKAGKTPIAQEGGVGSYNAWWFFYLLMRLKGPGAMQALAKDASAWDAPEVLEAATKVAQLVEAGFFQEGYSGSKYPNAQNAWAKGDYVFDLNGSWLAGETKDVAAKTAKFTTVVFPAVGANSKPVVEVSALGWSVSEKSTQKTAAFQLISFMSAKTYADMVGTEMLTIPARSDSSAPEYLKVADKASKTATLTTGLMDNTSVNNPTWMKDVFFTLNDQLIFGKIKPAEFVAQGKKKSADYIAAGTA